MSLNAFFKLFLLFWEFDFIFLHLLLIILYFHSSKCVLINSCLSMVKFLQFQNLLTSEVKKNATPDQ